MKIFAAVFAAFASTLGWSEPVVVSPRPDAVEIVIYRLHPTETSRLYENADSDRGIALITETREVDLPAGSSTIRFKQTAETIVPQTAKLLELPGNLIESNFDYNLISPETLITSSIGKTVRIQRTQRTSGKRFEDKAVIRSGPDGMVLDFGDHSEALGCSGLDESIIFDSVPESLVTEPSLSVKISAKRAGRYKIRLSYLATGFDWSADYVARLLPDGHSLDILGWITLSNRLSMSFPDATVKVVAGNLAVDDATFAQRKTSTKTVKSHCWPLHTPYVVASEGVSSFALRMPPKGLEEVIVTAQKMEAQLSELGDYKLYSLPRLTTLAANQTKQVLFLNKNNVSYERLYRFELDPDQNYRAGDTFTSSIILKLENKTKRGLGVPLPMGTVAAFDIDTSGNAIFAGDQWIRDVAIDSPTELTTGEAMEVWVSPRTVSSKSVERWWWKYREIELEVRVGNNKSVPVRMEIELDPEMIGEVRVSSESRPHRDRAGQPVWAYDLAPAQQEVLHVVLRAAR